MITDWFKVESDYERENYNQANSSDVGKANIELLIETDKLRKQTAKNSKVQAALTLTIAAASVTQIVLTVI
jgi:hypothetical protein